MYSLCLPRDAPCGINSAQTSGVDLGGRPCDAPFFGGDMEFIVIFGIAIVAMGFALYLSRYVMAQDCGTTEMQKISNAIKEGAEAFLKRMNKTIALLSLAFAVLLFLFYANYKGVDVAWKMTLGF